MSTVRKHSKVSEGGIHYTSKLMAALNRFTGNLAVEVANPMADKYGKAYEFLISADAYRYREEIDLAISNYREAINLRQDFTEAYIGIGKCFRRKGDTTGAIKSFKLALCGNAFDKDVILDLAKSYNEGGFIKQSMMYYKRAIKMDPNAIEAKFALALLYELDQDLTKASHLYQDIMTQNSDFFPALNNLGSVYLRMGKLELAEKAFRQLLEQSPDFNRAYLGLAITLDKIGKASEAIQAYYQVLALKPAIRNVDYVKKRIVALNQALGRSIQRSGTVLIRIK